MAQHRHKREAPARRLPRAVLVSAPLAVVATLSAVTMGVLAGVPATDDADLWAASVTSAGTTEGLHAGAASVARRGEVSVSRSQLRTAARAEAAARREMAAARRDAAADKATRRAVRTADTRLWTIEDLNLWDGPGEKATQTGLVDAVEKVLVTGRRQAGRAEIVVEGRSRWVTADYLAQDKPAVVAKVVAGRSLAGPSLAGVCSNGSSIDAGRASLYTIHDVVCANWPQVTSYGTWRGDGEHGQGRAIDIMVTGETGWAIADFLRANYSALGIEYIIFSQNIWSVERGGEGWRGMSDRGSTTANHYDHVHVTVY